MQKIIKLPGNTVYKITALLFFFFTCLSRGAAQILPKQDSKVNYRIIAFSIPAIRNSNGYVLEIAKGSYTTEDSFSRNLITTVNSIDNTVVTEVPTWGTSYTWRMTSATGNAKKKRSEFHQFSTGTCANIDTTITRLRIVQNADEYKDHYVFLDGTRALYNMDGDAVWYLPVNEDLFKENARMCDMKLTPFGTITFIIADQAYEVNYDGVLVWKGPANERGGMDKSEHFHHEFTRLANGHYMVLGNEFTEIEKSDSTQQRTVNKRVLQSQQKNKMAFGTLIEYDNNGVVKWIWRSADHFKQSDIFERGGVKNKAELSPHDNAFFYDEKNGNIYMSFKNISTIIKIKYPEGTVINTYGERFEKGKEAKGNGFFCGQHACKLSSKGDLYVYDNNSCGTPAVPRIVMMKEPETGNAQLKTTWYYNCVADDSVAGTRKPGQVFKYDFSSGGNAIELADGSMFACMSGYITDSAFTSFSPVDSKVFIVGRDKKIKWCAIPEKWNPGSKKWRRITQYRASIITSKKELEQLALNIKNEGS